MKMLRLSSEMSGRDRRHTKGQVALSFPGIAYSGARIMIPILIPKTHPSVIELP